ncbi:MAG: hypothetical protein ACRDNN_03310 [Gaiellaceae bacterium]
MADEVQPPPAAGLARSTLGERLGGFIYGTIIVLAVVVAGAKAYPDQAGQVAALVAVTSVVFWLAHVYAHGLAHSIARDEHLSLAALLTIARREGAIVEAALPPVAALLLGAFGLVSTAVAVWLAVGLGLLVLAVQGITFARVERLGPLATLGVVAANLGLGVVLVGLKLLLSH